MVFPKEGYSWIRNSYLRDSTITPTEKIVYLIVAGHANSETEMVSISLDQMERESGITPKTISKMLKQIERRGMIQIHSTKRKDGGTGRNEYKIINTHDYPLNEIDSGDRM